MRIAIFGASRGAGRAAVDAALAAGHSVTAFSRAGGTLPAGVDVVAGDALDSAAVARALAGADAVIIALGVTPGKNTGTPKDICSRGTRTILAEMKRARVERVVVVSSYGVGETQKRKPFVFGIIANTLLKAVIADKETQERDVRASGLKWTILQPLRLTDDPATGRPYASTDGSRKSTHTSRADVAAVAVEAIEHGTFIGESVALSSPA